MVQDRSRPSSRSAKIVPQARFDTRSGHGRTAGLLNLPVAKGSRATATGARSRAANRLDLSPDKPSRQDPQLCPHCSCVHQLAHDGTHGQQNVGLTRELARSRDVGGQGRQSQPHCDRKKQGPRDPEVAFFNKHIQPRPDGPLEEMFRTWSGNASKNSAVFCVETLDEDLVGHVALWGAEVRNRCATFGVVITPEQQSRGLGTGPSHGRLSLF